MAIRTIIGERDEYDGHIGAATAAGWSLPVARWELLERGCEEKRQPQ